MFKDDNLVQLGVLVRSSSLSNQVFESSASSMLNSWTFLAETGSSAMRHRKTNSNAPSYNAVNALVDPNQHVSRQALLMGHFDRLQWYKKSYDVKCTRSLIFRARTNEGFKNATIICKGTLHIHSVWCSGSI